MQEAIIYKKLPDNKVKCNVCNHRCTIAPNKLGICATRKNIKGKLYSLVYGLAIAEHIDPIEKKPLFHFLPGSKALSIATIGCNLRCSFCQNWQISQLTKKGIIEGEELPSKKIITNAQDSNCPVIAYTYTEPTIFLEYALGTMKLAKKVGIKNVWVSNGFMSEETIKIIKPFLNGINIDLKSFSADFYRQVCGARLQPVLDNIVSLKKLGVWVELTTLLVPNQNDSPKELKQIVEFISQKVGTDTPWHISRFHPDYQMTNGQATPMDTLEQAYQLAKDAGLKYVYLGNVISDKENTYCPHCQQLIIERQGYQIQRFDQQGRCPKCNFQLPGIF